MRRKAAKVWTAAVLVIILSEVAGGVEITLAPIIVDRNSQRLFHLRGAELARGLIRTIKLLDGSGSLVLRLGRVPSEGAGVVSVLDAASFAKYNGSDGVIYGRFAYTENYIDAAIAFFDPATGRIESKIYGRDSSDREARLIDDMGRKVHEYLTGTLGLAPVSVPRAPDRVLWDYRIGLGYWSPVGPWRNALSGISSVELSGYLTPVYPILEEGSRLWGLRVGGSLIYSLGINTPDSESFVYNGIRFGIPMDFAADYRKEHRMGVGVQPFVAVDLVSQERRYSSGRWNGISATGGVVLNVYYRFRLNPGSGIGISAETAFVFYSPLRIEIRSVLFYEHRIGSGKKKRRSS